MTEKKGHFDEDLDLRISPEFSADLHTLFKPHFSVPPEVDRAIMDQAHRRFVRRKRRSRLLRRAGSIAAAAAVIILAFSLNLTQRPGSSTSQSTLVEAQAIDIDRNGRVDILDAFKLARHIESADRTDKKWDINEDGVVNRKDVDLVALAAVRLDKDKGVL